MPDKNVQIKDLSGNNLFPKTKGSMVFNDNNQALGGVEAGSMNAVLTLTEKAGLLTFDEIVSA